MEERNLQAIDGATLMGLHLEPTRFLRGHTAAPGGVLSGRGVQDWQVLDGVGLVRPHRQGGAGVGPAHPEGNHPVPVSGGHPPPGAGSAEPHHRRGAGERLLLRPGGDPWPAGLLEEIRRFVGQHPDTVLVAVDTFAVVRALGGDQTYGSDYQEVRQLKACARMS